MWAFGLASALLAASGVSPLVAAESAVPSNLSDSNRSPYHLALIAYKSGRLNDARAEIDRAEIKGPEAQPAAILKARIVAEQGDADGARKILLGLGHPKEPGRAAAIDHALGDVLLLGGRFDEAWSAYARALRAQPDDQDILLAMVYSRVGAGDLPKAAAEAVQLKPFDPIWPNYYFAQAALNQVNGKSIESDPNIATARTLYGNLLVNQYLRTYLRVFAEAEKKSPAARMTPPALEKNAPAKP